eukprot:1131008-Amphidinium_carterae.1
MNESQPVMTPPFGRVFLKQLFSIFFGLTLLLGEDLSLPVGKPVDVTIHDLMSKEVRNAILQEVSLEQPYVLH